MLGLFLHVVCLKEYLFVLKDNKRNWDFNLFIGWLINFVNKLK